MLFHLESHLGKCSNADANTLPSQNFRHLGRKPFEYHIKRTPAWQDRMIYPNFQYMRFRLTIIFAFILLAHFLKAQKIELQIDSMIVKHKSGIDAAFKLENITAEYNAKYSDMNPLTDLGISGSFGQSNTDTFPDFTLNTIESHGDIIDGIQFMFNRTTRNYDQPIKMTTQPYEEQGDDAFQIYLSGFRINDQHIPAPPIWLIQDFGSRIEQVDVNFDGHDDIVINPFGFGMNVFRDFYTWRPALETFERDTFLSPRPNVSFDWDNKSISTMINNGFSKFRDVYKKDGKDWILLERLNHDYGEGNFEETIPKTIVDHRVFEYETVSGARRIAKETKTLTVIFGLNLMDASIESAKESMEITTPQYERYKGQWLRTGEKVDYEENTITREQALKRI